MSLFHNSINKISNLLKEVRVRFVGFGADEDEWVNVKNAVRECSVPLEPSDCHKLKVGGHVLCFQVILNSLLSWKQYQNFSQYLPFHLNLSLSYLNVRKGEIKQSIMMLT